ncbi:MAG TPA: TldD/PmbA family protein, partial [Elusimicrobiota bacterium]|nr:TldD/PmbA family protein [Elusimicrobiota bacterium]
MNVVEAGTVALGHLRRRWPQAQADVFVAESRMRSSEWSEGLPENQELTRSHGIGVRVINDGRLGFGHANRLESAALDALADRVTAAARFTAQDPWLGVAPPAAGAGDPSPDLQLVDSSLTEETWPGRSAFLESIERDVRSRDKRLTKVLRASYREGRSRCGIQNTSGVSASYEATQVSFSMACVAVDQGETQIGYGFQAVRHFRDLNIPWVLDKAVEGALSLLGGRQIPSGRYDLVLDPWVAAEMLELFAHALRADQVQKGRSFLGDKKGRRIASAAVELVDDARLPRGLGSSPVDAEGQPTTRRVLVQDGVLQGFLYDVYTARKENASSTGNAGRGSYKAMPEPEASNFFLKAGSQTPEKLIAGIDNGLFVRHVMG